ncbi:helix-turn-helix transcriptional regulator [Microbacter margulisiae]|uniref:DNA-binding CsgD family transcriptional regulator n=1 Tax=Microbacter margulisiae TaxID=1350067 RepID=A0A7W5H133_9PORP|nr:LuxR C-terminal-related transcriptional regulator [Microbacter margulisiae]MBB3186229.1 DNA-binding CsgD family transcriptional regulator [Microbacter margulisiae]
MNSSVCKEHADLIHYHLCKVGKKRYAMLEQELPRLLKIARGNHSLNFCFDLHKGSYALVDPRFYPFSGRAMANDTDKKPKCLFMDLIHPDDLACVLTADQQAYHFFMSLPVSEQAHFEMVSNFRMRSASGKYIRVLRRMIPFEYDNDDKLWLIHIIVDQLEFVASQEKPQAWIFNTTNKKMRLAKGDIHKNKEFDLVSGRQIKVLEMTVDGKGAHIAAEQLFISKKTVHSHHQTILSRTKSKNMTQAFHCLRILRLICNAIYLFTAGNLVDWPQTFLCLS